MRPFADVVRDLNGGQFYDDLGSALQEIVQGVVEHRKGGELVIKLNVKPNSDSTVLIRGEYKVKAPEAPRGDTLFFATTDGALVRDDPRQHKLPLREVKEPERGELKEAADVG